MRPKAVSDRKDSQGLEAQRAQLAKAVAARAHPDGVHATGIPGLSLYRRSSPTACTSATYEPTLIVFVQGRKRIDLGGTELLCDASTFLLTSVDLPVVSQVTDATPEEPVLGLILQLDMSAVREILGQQEFRSTDTGCAMRGMALGTTSRELLDACQRLIALLDSPEDIPFLGNMLQREIIYRILKGPQGKHLRAIATLGEQGNRTARAVAWLRANFSKPLRVEDLATAAHMGVSTFHHHFRSLTSMSPLQYQKRLRLHFARERILTAGLDAATAAFEVGYESPSQFSREYRRFFGQPPMRDAKVHRGSSAALAAD